MARGRGSDFSNRVYSVAYRHAKDGQDYKHDFGPGVRMRSNRNGSVTISNDDTVWEGGFPGSGGSMKFLKNPLKRRWTIGDASAVPTVRPKRRRKAKMAKRRKRRTPPRGRGGRFMKRASSRRRRRVAAAAPRRRRRRAISAAPRRRRRRVVRRGYVTIKRHQPGGGSSGRLTRVRRRAYRRNPGIIPTIIRGVKDAALVTAGKVGSNLVTRKLASFSIPLPGMAGDVVKSLAIAFGVSFVAAKVTKGDTARMITAGAYQAVVEGLIRAVNVPLISDALGEYDILRGNYSGLGSYARAMPSGVGAYPSASPAFEGEYAG